MMCYFCDEVCDVSVAKIPGALLSTNKWTEQEMCVHMLIYKYIEVTHIIENLVDEFNYDILNSRLS